MELAYDASWLSSPAARPVSLSLPLGFDRTPLTGDKVGFYFDNLLPDSAPIRQRIRARFNVVRDDAFGLLEAVGRDCVGALQLLPEGDEPTSIEEIAASPLSDAEVERLLIRTTAAPSRTDDDDDDDFRLSIAGAQEKTALTWHRGRWCRPHGATPTTHIFKLPLGLVGGRQLDMRHSLENEWLCSRLLEGFGLPIASCELRTFGEMKALVVERFDRQLHSSRRYWLRLPQEDLCQATGTPSTRKYEADGGPGLTDLARVLAGSTSREVDLRTLLTSQLLFWMLAATDGHAKNFSLRLLAGSQYQLTPLYDVLSAWPIAGGRHDQVHPKKLKLAMALRGKSKHYSIDSVTRAHFNATARTCGLASDMEPIIAEVIARTPAVIDEVGARLPDGYSAHLFDSITSGLRRSAKLLGSMPPR